MAELFGKDLAFPLVSKLATLKHHATHTIRWHAHDGLEIHFVFSGALTYEFAHDARTCTIPGGSFLIIPARKRHRAANDKGAPANRLGIQFGAPTEAATRQTVFRTTELKRLFAAFRQHALVPVRFRKRTGARAREICRLAETWENADGRPERAAHLRALVCALLVETFGDLQGKGPLPPPPESVADTIRAHICAHCGEPLSIDDLVRLSGYGRTRLFALFAAETGTTPIDYLNRCRIDKAKALLARPEGQTLTDLASACGFASSAYFTRVFRKYIGLSPQEFRSFPMISVRSSSQRRVLRPSGCRRG